MTIHELLDANLLEIFGLDKLSEKEEGEFLEKSASVVLDRTIERITKECPKETSEGFFRTFKEGVSDGERWKFIQEQIPNLEDMLLQELVKFKAEAIEIAKKTK